MLSRRYILLIIIGSLIYSCGSKTESISRKTNVKILPTEFIYNKINLSDIQHIEEKNKGIQYTKPYKIGLSKDYLPDIVNYEFAQPIIYRRDTTNLDTQVSYFFTKKDSILRLIEYSWSQDDKHQLFIDKLYNFNKKSICKTFGEGDEKYQKIDYWWQKIIRWDNDSIHVYSFIFGTDQGAKNKGNYKI
ncbi:hypothetical protein [Chryseobacterium wanjuense]